MFVYRVARLVLLGSTCLFLMTAVACSPLGATATPSPVSSPVSATGATPLVPQAPPEAPAPEPGKASVSGVLYSFSVDRNIPETVFYLTPARGEAPTEPPTILAGPHPEEGDVRGVSDAQGRVTLNNAPPGNYYMAVWAPYNWILVTESDTDPTPRLITLSADGREDLGMLYLCWP